MLYVLIGIIAWQVIVTIIFIISGENKTITSRVGGGIPLNILAIIFRLLRKIEKAIRYSGVRSILIDTYRNKWFWCYPKEADYLRDTHDLEFPKWTPELKEKYPQRLWSKYFIKSVCSFDVGNFRYAPKGVWKDFEQFVN